MGTSSGRHSFGSGAGNAWYSPWDPCDVDQRIHGPEKLNRYCGIKKVDYEYILYFLNKWYMYMYMYMYRYDTMVTYGVYIYIYNGINGVVIPDLLVN